MRREKRDDTAVIIPTDRLTFLPCAVVVVQVFFWGGGNIEKIRNFEGKKELFFLL
jgi:hypothetical protein